MNKFNKGISEKSFSKFSISITSILFVSSVLQLGNLLYSRYFPLLLCVAFLTCYKIIQGVKLSNNFKKILTLNLFSLLLFILLSFLGNSTYQEFLFDTTKLGLAFIAAIWFYYFSENSSFSNISKAIILMTIIAQIIMVVVLYNAYSDFSIRLFLQNFHSFKVKSLFFYDTNALSIFGLAYFSFLLYYYRHNHKSKLIKSLLIIFIFLIVLCLSRASILALLIVLFYDFYIGRSIIIKRYINLILVLILGFYFFEFFKIISTDGSGFTKIEIYKSVYDKIPLETLRSIIFGNGINAGNYTYSYEIGKYSHALFPMLLGQFGFLGLLFYNLYFYLHSFLFSNRNLYLLIPLFITGLSYLHPFLETIFILNALIIGIENKKIKK